MSTLLPVPRPTTSSEVAPAKEPPALTLVSAEQPGAPANSGGMGLHALATMSGAAQSGEAFDTRVNDQDWMAPEAPLPASVTPDLQKRILHTAYEMSLVQAMNPREKDGTGFSNADYPFGAVVSTQGNVRACAMLLLGYTRQAEGYGLSQDDLAWAQPAVEAGSTPVAAAREALADLRDQARGQTAWAEKDTDTVLIVPYSGGWEDKRVLRQFGVKTPTGFEVSKANLNRVLAKLSGGVINRDALVEIAQAFKQEAAASGNLEMLAAISKVRLVATQIPGSSDWLVKYNDPFSPEGVQIKEIVKKFGGTFDGGAKGWKMTYQGVQMLSVAASDLDDVDPLGLPVHPDSVPASYRREAELVMAGIQPVAVHEEKLGKVLFGTRSRNEILFAACAALKPGIRWDGERRAYEGTPDAILKLISNLESEPTLDVFALTKAARRVAKVGMEKALEAAKAFEDLQKNVGALVVPDCTPTGKTFFSHQPEAIQFLLKAGLHDPDARGAILADDMGLGKTVEAIVAAHLKHPEGRKLLVTPGSLQLNWRKEIRTWLGVDEMDRAQALLSGGKIFNPEARWIIISYGLLNAYEKQIREWKPDLAIYDEAHLLKEDTAQRTKIVVGADKKTLDFNGRTRWTHSPGLAESIPTNWPMTGTPIKNRTMEVYNLLRIINHELARGPFARIEFGKRYCDGKEVEINRAGDLRWEFEGASNIDELGDKLHPYFLQRLKKDVLNLPPCIESAIPVDLGPGGLKAYKAALKDLLGKDIDAPDDGGPKIKGEDLRKMTLMKMHTAIIKIPFAIEWIESALANGQKIAVFTTYHEVLDALQEKFKDVSVRLDGSVSKTKRQEVVDRFQEDPSVMVFLGQNEAAGVGITLTAAQEGLLVDTPYVPGDYKQIRDRLNRIGQAGTVNFRSLCAEGTFDDVLLEMIQEKVRVIEAIEKAIKDGKPVDQALITKANADVATELFKYLKKQARAAAREEKKAAKEPKVKKSQKGAAPEAEA